MDDLGLAVRLDDIMSGMLEMEVTRMFGGYGFLINGHMCLSVWDDRLVIRIGTDGWNAICNQPHVGPKDFTGKVMKGWAMIQPDGLSEDDDLRHYVDMAVMVCAVLPTKTETPTNAVLQKVIRYRSRTNELWRGPRPDCARQRAARQWQAS